MNKVKVIKQWRVMNRDGTITDYNNEVLIKINDIHYQSKKFPQFRLEVIGVELPANTNTFQDISDPGGDVVRIQVNNNVQGTPWYLPYERWIYNARKETTNFRLMNLDGTASTLLIPKTDCEII